MRRLPAEFVCIVALMLPASARAENACFAVAEASAVVAEASGVSFAHPVPCLMLSEDELAARSRAMLAREIPPEKLRGEGLLYRLLGLIPASFDYPAEIARLYSQSSVGVYDSRMHELGLLRGSSAEETLETLVHELEHAQQDQRFNLSRYRDHRLSSDELLARNAVVEGDALRVEHAAVLRDRYRPLLERLQRRLGGEERSRSQAPHAPLPPALERLMYFSYEFGPRFLETTGSVSGGRNLERYFRDPPRSASEVLHPELYARGEAPPEITVDGSELLQSGFREIFTDRIGEYALRVLLALRLDAHEANEAAAAWVADRAVVFERSSSGQTVLLWEIRAGDNDSAVRLAEGLRTAFSSDSSRSDRVSVRVEAGCIRVVVSSGDAENPGLARPQCSISPPAGRRTLGVARGM